MTTIWLVEYHDGYECSDVLAVFSTEEKALAFAALWPGLEADAGRRIGWADARPLELNSPGPWAEAVRRLARGQRLYAIERGGDAMHEWDLPYAPGWLDSADWLVNISGDGDMAYVWASSLEEALELARAKFEESPSCQA